MGRLLPMQPDGDPFEYTHYDCWDVYPFDEEADSPLVAREMQSVIACWNDTLDAQIDAFVFDDFDGYEVAIWAMGFDGVMDRIITNILRAGFDVYEGDGFIEIYKGDDDE